MSFPVSGGSTTTNSTPPVTPVVFGVTEADFVDGFYTLNYTNGQKIGISKYLCATLAATLRLQEHLATLGFHPAISLDYPEPGWPAANLYGQSGLVPYLDFTYPDQEGVEHENAAGILVEYLRFSVSSGDNVVSNFWYKGAN